MRVFVTGATGFVGRNAVEAFRKSGHEITAGVNMKRQDYGFSEDIPVAPCPVDDSAAMGTSFAGHDVVVHLVGIIAETRTKTFEQTVARGTENVVAACRQAGVGKIVYLSALGTKPGAASWYHRTKFHAEEAVKSSGLMYSILRPSVIYGPGDGFVTLLAKMLTSAPITPVIGDGRYRLQPIHIDDLAPMIVRSATEAVADFQTIDIAGPEKLEYLEILGIIKTVLNKRRPKLFLPVWLMRRVAGILEKIVKPAPLTRDQITMMLAGNTGDITLMREIFGIEPREFKNGLLTYLGK